MEEEVEEAAAEEEEQEVTEAAEEGGQQTVGLMRFFNLWQVMLIRQLLLKSVPHKANDAGEHELPLSLSHTHTHTQTHTDRLAYLSSRAHSRSSDPVYKA